MKPKLLIIPVLVIALLAIAAYSTGWFRHDSGLQGSGTVEARDIRSTAEQLHLRFSSWSGGISDGCFSIHALQPASSVGFVR